MTAQPHFLAAVLHNASIWGTALSARLAPAAFVTDGPFPFASQHLAAFLTRRWGDFAVCHALALVVADAGAPSLREWAGDAGEDEQRAIRVAHLHRLMATDARATAAQGGPGPHLARGLPRRPPAIGAVRRRAPGPPALARGLPLRIDSSAGVAAQRVFFAHTTAGDLTPRSPATTTRPPGPGASPPVPPSSPPPPRHRAHRARSRRGEPPAHCATVSPSGNSSLTSAPTRAPG